MTGTTVVSSSDSVKVAEMPKSKRSVGCAESSISTPVECASGTLIAMRDEQVPASAGTWRSSISAWNAAMLNWPRPSAKPILAPSS